MKIAVIGSRTFFDKDLLYSTLDKYRDKIELIVSGGAVGADSLAQDYAKDRGLPILIIYPEWYKSGEFDKGAGFKRNIEIIKLSSHVVAFWDGKSNGTRHSLLVAKKEGKPVKLVKFTSPIDGYYFINDDHPLSWSAEREIQYNEITFKSVKHGYAYFAADDEEKQEVLTLDLTKKRDLDRIDKIVDRVKTKEDNVRKTLNRLLYELVNIDLEQHSEWMEFLKKTDGKIVYATNDNYFGIGMNKSNPMITATERWGRNILGLCLNKTREANLKAFVG